MNKKIISLFIGCLLLVIGVFYHGEIAKALGIILRSGADVSTGSLKMSTNIATSSPQFLQNGLGTTTLVIASDNLSSLTLYMYAVASSTNINSPMNIRLQASDDNIDFFDYDLSPLNPASFINVKATSTIDLASTTQVYFFQPSRSTTTKAYDLKLLPARYTKVIFYLATSTDMNTAYKDGTKFWANLVGKIQ